MCGSTCACVFSEKVVKRIRRSMRKIISFLISVLTRNNSRYMYVCDLVESISSWACLQYVETISV